MPRLDNSNSLVQEEYSYTFNDDDPGCTPPVDVCGSCARYWEKIGVDDLVEHPPYEEQDPPYICWDCGSDLCEEDN